MSNSKFQIENVYPLYKVITYQLIQGHLKLKIMPLQKSRKFIIIKFIARKNCVHTQFNETSRGNII